MKMDYDGKISKGKLIFVLDPAFEFSGRDKLQTDQACHVISVKGDKVTFEYRKGEPHTLLKSQVMLWINDPEVLKKATQPYSLSEEMLVSIKHGEFYFFSREVLKAIEEKSHLELQIPRLRHKERGQGITTYSLGIEHVDCPTKEDRYFLTEDFETGGDTVVEVFNEEDEAMAYIDDMDFTVD